MEPASYSLYYNKQQAEKSFYNYHIIIVNLPKGLQINFLIT